MRKKCEKNVKKCEKNVTENVTAPENVIQNVTQNVTSPENVIQNVKGSVTGFGPPPGTSLRKATPHTSHLGDFDCI